MKSKIFLSTLIIAGACLGTSCKKNFETINQDPNHITPEIQDYNLLLSASEVYIGGTDYDTWRNGLIYGATMMQHLASTQDYWNGDKYTYSAGYNSAFWDRQYPNGVADIQEVINKYKDDATKQNAYNIARILRVFLFQQMTDLYGDVPYSEAGLGYISKVTYPKYDKQQDIYTSLHNELKAAATALSATATNTVNGTEMIYKGDVTLWKKFAYTEMLRLGMRLTKIDATTGKAWVQEAIAGGVFTSNTDNAILKHEANTTDAANAYGKVLVYQDPDASRVSKTFIDLLKNTSDPRLTYIATVATNPGVSYGSSGFDYGDTTATKQVGMPNGYDELNGATDISKALNWPGDIKKYSIVNRYTYARVDAPTFLLTYAETKLLMSEAAYRGWISGDAATYYADGVTAAMQQMTQNGAATGISNAQISAYLTKNAYNAATALQQINTQYWIATFLDEYEAWSNYRRSGYPALTQVNYFGNVTNGTIPRRFTYPTSEQTINTTNYNDAVSRLSNGDKMTSRVWWDKQ
ncbi:SusD/RagB family nutrient-binding outer membrane lipoprotein [Mucilaginibacter robiniae]|uniref:SusD/RagB family nutrient-binding outer membrane lipoprotein n=1 Tax=Mucilaginibacter robiniae TaxID=2728022 RepID=A0A7L5E2S9_9SPHI|nr:SusD/RagB family nutrient-binding outer membrane lipoprotein [Mucilaginibacter robiniae]QJD97680.1 SusD/RagB family nutrient-binding outer membrane lipoprotein [Mucilaginibacter robiniae]